MSVENFFQESIFEDIFPAVAKAQNFQSDRTPRKRSKPESTASSSTILALPEFRVIRSTRRKRGITAFRNNGIIEIHIPDRTLRRDEATIIPEMINLVLTREAKSRRGDDQLAQISESLLSRYLPEFHERPSSIRWRSMQGRWGSCTTVDRTIRIADRLASAPAYVIECVIFHELIHLRIPGHGADFKELLARFPDLERAEAYLEGFEAGIGAPAEAISTEDIDEEMPSISHHA
jgi:predicted metal-dependent hydrolase